MCSSIVASFGIVEGASVVGVQLENTSKSTHRILDPAGALEGHSEAEAEVLGYSRFALLGIETQGLLENRDHLFVLFAALIVLDSEQRLARARRFPYLRVQGLRLFRSRRRLEKTSARKAEAMLVERLGIAEVVPTIAE